MSMSSVPWSNSIRSDGFFCHVAGRYSTFIAIVRVDIQLSIGLAPHS